VRSEPEIPSCTIRNIGIPVLLLTADISSAMVLALQGRIRIQAIV
jgi:hypothetical protein